MENQSKPFTHISVPSEHNPLLQKAVERVNETTELLTLWKIMNVNAMDRLKMSDHGIIHFQIVSNMALRMARILQRHDTPLSIIKDHKLTHNHGELVIFFASIMHDLGISIHRDGHEEYSLFLANRLLHEMIDFLPIEEKTIVISETLHAIISHRSNGKPYTIEAGIVRVSDALDMSEGRSRIPYQAGAIDIYNLSAAAIDSVQISEGDEKPIAVEIIMNNSAGLFQVDDLLNTKLKGSGIEKLVDIKAYIGSETEKSLLKEYIVK
jgi:uncharacterized protein